MEKVEQETDKKAKLCVLCLNKKVNCICDLCPEEKWASPLKVVVLQHPKEKEHFNNSVSILVRVLSPVEVIVSRKPDSVPLIKERDIHSTALLFKSSKSMKKAEF